MAHNKTYEVVVEYVTEVKFHVPAISEQDARSAFDGALVAEETVWSTKVVSVEEVK